VLAEESGEDIPEASEDRANSDEVPAGKPAGGGEREKEASTSSRATASLVLGLSSILLSALTAVPGIVYGILGLREVWRSDGELKGQGRAIAGICLSVVFLGITGVLAVDFFTLWPERPLVHRKACMNKMLKMGKALGFWHKEHDSLPKSLARLRPDYMSGKKPFVCPADPNPPTIQDGLRSSYRYSGPLPRKLRRNASRAILAYERAILHDEGEYVRHKRGRYVLFYTKNVRWVKETRLRKLLKLNLLLVRKADDVKRSTEKLRRFYLPDTEGR